MKGHGPMDMGGMDGGMDSSSGAGPMPMSLLLSCSCRVGPLFVRAWTIETCGWYYVSLVVIALVCFLRHLLTMYKTRLILRLPEDATGKCAYADMRHVRVWTDRPAACMRTGGGPSLAAVWGIETTRYFDVSVPLYHQTAGAAGVHRGMLQAACCSTADTYGSTRDERRKLGACLHVWGARASFLLACLLACLLTYLLACSIPDVC